jgi:hypothetical protein
MLRLNFASRLCWTSPELSIADIAEACGLLDRAYFHRTSSEPSARRTALRTLTQESDARCEPPGAGWCEGRAEGPCSWRASIFATPRSEPARCIITDEALVSGKRTASHGSGSPAFVPSCPSKTASRVLFCGVASRPHAERRTRSAVAQAPKGQPAYYELARALQTESDADHRRCQMLKRQGFPELVS